MLPVSDFFRPSGLIMTKVASAFILIFEQTEKNGTVVLKSNNQAYQYSFQAIGQNRYSLIHNGQSHLLHITKENGIYHVHFDGQYFPVRVEDERTRILRKLVQQAKQATGEEIIIAPIPGLITKIKVNKGDKIQPGDSLVILEAMKMENEIKADTHGTVEQILVKEGAPVEKDQKLLTIN